ncbi:MAG: putative methyl-accepting chemotaxis protein, partial [Modestobacter sp.]|nr:putative methyl-accepting chemotaxis protein [Modestobacter sp.]
MVHSPSPRPATATPVRTGRGPGWFADRPVAAKIGVTVGLLGLVSVGLTGLASVHMSNLSAKQDMLYTESVEPLTQLAGIQRSFQGDRARYITYPLADATARQALLKELVDRRNTLQSQLSAYEPLATSPADFTALTTDLDAWYAVATQQLVPAADAASGAAATAAAALGGAGRNA